MIVVELGLSSGVVLQVDVPRMEIMRMWKNALSEEKYRIQPLLRAKGGYVDLDFRSVIFFGEVEIDV